MKNIEINSSRHRLSKGLDMLHEGIRRIHTACDAIGLDDESYETLIELDTEFLKIVRKLRQHYNIPYFVRDEVGVRED